MDNGAFAAAVWDLAASSALSPVEGQGEGGELKADVNFHSPSDPGRAKVMRIIHFPACERHAVHVSFTGVPTMTEGPRHGGNPHSSFLPLSLQHRPMRGSRFLPERMRDALTPKKKPPAEAPGCRWGVNGEVQRNGATMLSAA